MGIYVPHCADGLGASIAWGFLPLSLSLSFSDEAKRKAGKEYILLLLHYCRKWRHKKRTKKKIKNAVQFGQNSFVGFVWRAIHNSLCVDMF